MSFLSFNLFNAQIIDHKKRKMPVVIIKTKKLGQKFTKKLEGTSYFSSIYGTVWFWKREIEWVDSSMLNPREKKSEFQYFKACSNSSEYEIFKNFIYEKIFPLTPEDNPAGLPEVSMAVICENAWVVVWEVEIVDKVLLRKVLLTIVSLVISACSIQIKPIQRDMFT